MITSARQEVNAYIISRTGQEVAFQTTNGGAINLTVGHKDPQGFFILLSPSATEGLLSVKPLDSDSFITFPFFKGRNSMLIKEVNSTGHTATDVYWEK